MRPGSIALSLAFVFGAASAHAETVEPRTRLMVRAAPSSGARIVERIAGGHRLQVIGRSEDGAWVRVQTPHGPGWVPASALKRGARPAAAEEESAEAENAPPLAAKHGVRAEAWVSSSKYHTIEDGKMTISANKAELYGRPAKTGAVLGIARRGEVVRLVRKSADRRWCLVDVGGGEMAWLESHLVRAGAFRAPATADDPTIAEPPPVSERAQRMPAERVTPEEIAERERTAPPPAPVARRARRVEAPPPEPPPAPEPPVRVARNDDEPAPDLTPAPAPPPRKRGKQLASRGGSDASPSFAAASADRSSSELSVSRPLVRESSPNAFSIGLQAGIAILAQRFTSNGTGALSNYESSTNALGVAFGLGYQRAVGRYLRLGIDGSYTFAGVAGVRYRLGDGSSVILAVQNHTLDFGASAGAHFNVIGGLDIGLRLGGEFALDLIAASATAPLPSDRVLGMTIGVGASAPALAHLAGRPFGLRISGGGLVPADRAQTHGLEEGTSSTTVGAFFGGAATLGLLAPPAPGKKYVGNLVLAFSYNYNVAATHYNGPSHRNPSITSADRGSAQHLIGLGLVYAY